jgi:hypothetical protein
MAQELLVCIGVHRMTDAQIDSIKYTNVIGLLILMLSIEVRANVEILAHILCKTVDIM